MTTKNWREDFIKEFEYTDETNFIMDFIETQIAQAEKIMKEKLFLAYLEGFNNYSDNFPKERFDEWYKNNISSL